MVAYGQRVIDQVYPLMDAMIRFAHAHTNTTAFEYAADATGPTEHTHSGWKLVLCVFGHNPSATGCGLWTIDIAAGRRRRFVTDFHRTKVCAVHVPLSGMFGQKAHG